MRLQYRRDSLRARLVANCPMGGQDCGYDQRTDPRGSVRGANGSPRGDTRTWLMEPCRALPRKCLFMPLAARREQARAVVVRTSDGNVTEPLQAHADAQDLGGAAKVPSIWILPPYMKSWMETRVYSLRTRTTSRTCGSLPRELRACHAQAV
jgi:hypothetical protein